jgi:site-specific DNA-methyltransferase (adenine-specific)
VPPGGKERTGYPNQKPLGILRRIVQASSPPGGLVADFFAGSGTTGVAAAELGRRFLLVDNNPQACRIMAERLGNIAGVVFVGFRASASSSRRQTVEGTDPDRPARDGCEAQNGRPGRRENRPGPSRTRPR